MNARLIPISLIVLSALYAGVGLLIRERRPGLAAKSFAWMMFSIAVWSLGYGLELIAPDLSGKFFWSRVEIFGIASVAVFLLFFSAAYTGRSNLLSLRSRVLLWIIPAITCVLAWTHPYRFFIWETIAIGEYGGLAYFVADFGIWFWVQTTYSYFLILIASAFLFLEFLQSPRPYNVQAGIVLLGVLLPSTGSLL